MKIQFHGAVRTVTGSCHHLKISGHELLLDCGLYQGRRKDAFRKNREFGFDPQSIDGVVLSHAHIDHSGNLPTLARAGFKGAIYATPATRDLCEWMLRDAAHIQEKDVAYVNRRRRKQRKVPFEPLYTMRDAEAALKLFREVPYECETEIGPGIRLTFRDAGHILGSASCHLRIQDAEEEKVVVFTGDIGRPKRPILRDPVPPTRADVLITESTYGNRLHPPRADVAELLYQVVKDTFQRGGKVLIPAFSVGRTQRLVYHLNELFEQRKLPPVPIFVDSPLSSNVTDVFRDHPECYDQEALSFKFEEGDPFGFRRLTYIRDVEASKALNKLPVPCVIIASSGMCEAGRVLHHLKQIAPGEANTILVVGYMAEHTLGRRIADRAAYIKLYGEEFPLRARVENNPGLSAHADRDELLEYLGHLDRMPQHTFLVHGEVEAAEDFAGQLRKRGFPKVDVPAPGQIFEV